MKGRITATKKRPMRNKQSPHVSFAEEASQPRLELADVVRVDVFLRQFVPDDDGRHSEHV